MKQSQNSNLLHKPQIKFDRTVAAPKTPHQFQTQSYTNININNSIISQQFSLKIILFFHNRQFVTLTFHYQQQTKICQLIAFIKTQIGMDCVYFTSNNILIDYFLTLQNRHVIQLKYTTLYLNIQPINISNKITLKQINILKCIGIGGFSKVLLADYYGIIMAIKIINKDFILNNSKQTLIQNQKNILLLSSQHPFITKLYFSFQTQKYIIFGLQYCNGGQLFNLLKKIKKMKQSDAKFYFLQILMAIQHLHSQGILYRDLKPQNILIDADGHLRLADFGLSKIINRNVTYSFCGSAEYIAPQMLLKKGHSYQVDYYCLGALVYQLVTGLPPFYTINQKQLFTNILHNQLTFPSHANISQQLKLFLKKMLQKQPRNRFQNIQQILNNTWVIHNFNRQLILNKKLIPPFINDIFQYNFDDSDFCLNQVNILREIQREKQFDKTPLHYFTNFYYQSKQIKQIKAKYASNIQSDNSQKSFLKKTKKCQNEQSYKSLTRKNSLQQCKSPQYKSSKNIKNPTTTPLIDYSQASFPQHKETKQSPTAHTHPHPHHPPKQVSQKTLTIYTNKPKYIACPPQKNSFLQNNSFIKTLQQKYLSKIISSHSLEKNSFDFHQQKYNSLDKSYPNKKKSELPSTTNYLLSPQNKLPNTKIKKSFRQAQKVNFYYTSNKNI